MENGINLNLRENAYLPKVQTFFHGNFPAILVPGILRNLSGIFLTVYVKTISSSVYFPGHYSLMLILAHMCQNVTKCFIWNSDKN